MTMMTTRGRQPAVSLRWPVWFHFLRSPDRASGYYGAAMTLQRAALWAIVIAATSTCWSPDAACCCPSCWASSSGTWSIRWPTPSSSRGSAGVHLPRPLALLAAICAIGGLFWSSAAPSAATSLPSIAAAPNYESRLQKLIDQGARLVGIEQAPTLSELFDRISLADTLGGLAAAAASVVSVAGIVLIYAGFLFVEQVHFRRKLAIIFGDAAAIRRACAPCSTRSTATSASISASRPRSR